MNIVERIKWLRKNKLKLTQQEFASQIKVSRSNYGNIETGQIRITDRVISDICDAFHISESWLRTGEGEMFVQTKEDLFSRLAAENDLNDFDLMVLKTYVSLKPDQRQALYRFFDAMSAVKTDQQLAAEVDAEMAAELAAEREERIMEKDTPMFDPSTASSAG